MDYQLVYNVLTVLEIIGAEFTSIWVLSKKKHKFSVSFGLYAAITIVLMFFMCFVAVKLPGYGNGNGRFMVLGALYFIPALVNYGGDWKYRIIIAFYSFSYGLAIFAIAVRVGYLFEKADFSLTVLIAQTLIYALTLPPYLRFSKKQVIVYMQKANHRQKNLLIRYTIVSFLLIITYNNLMVMDASPSRKLLVYLLLIYFIVLTYHLSVSYLKADDDNQELSELAKKDRLTQLGNRLALRNDLDERLERQESFYLLFIDLDNFKSVNDHYGHAAGDAYLRAFSEVLRQCADESTSCFRMAGDEFICLTRDEQFISRVSGLLTGELGGVPFLGVSIGSARYPDDSATIPELLELADHRMYEQKMKKSDEQL